MSRPGDVALERIIAEISSALASTGDARFVILQREAIGLRSAERVGRMERDQGLAVSYGPHRVVITGEAHQ